MSSNPNDREESLIQACRWGELSIVIDAVQVLGVSVNIKDEFKRPLLSVATKGGNEQIVRLLIQHNADLDAVDESGNTALMEGAINGKSECVYALVSAGANLHKENKYGFRACTLAKKRGHAVLGSSLDDAGSYADLERDYDPVIQRARQLAWKPLVEQWMVNHIANQSSNTPRLTATDSRKRNETEETVILKKEEKLSNTSAFSRSQTLATPEGNRVVTEVETTRSEAETALDTAFVAAARSGDLDTVRSLLTRGALVSALDKYRRPALLLAAKGGHTSVVNYLIEAKADLDAVDTAGNTAVMEAAIYGHTDLLFSLIRAGANLSKENVPGYRAVLLASKRGHAFIAKALESAGSYADLDDHYDPDVQRAKQAVWNPPANDTPAITDSKPLPNRLGGKPPRAVTTEAPKERVQTVKTPVAGFRSSQKKRHLLSGMHYLTDPVVIEASLRYEVCIEGCLGCTFRVDCKDDDNKFKSLIVTGCRDCVVTFPSTVGNLEIINCSKLSVHPTGTVPIITIDGSDRVTVELTDASQNTAIYTAKSSSINMRRQAVDGSVAEVMLPEQVRHTFDQTWRIASIPIVIE
jgi:ankyrin repeat protein